MTLQTVAHQALLFMGILHATILEWIAIPSSSILAWEIPWTEKPGGL